MQQVELNYENLSPSIFNKIKKQILSWRCFIYQRHFLYIFGAHNQEVYRRPLPPFCAVGLKQIFIMANVCCWDHSEKTLPFLIFPLRQQRGLLPYPQAYPSFVAAISLHTTDVSIPDSTFSAYCSLSVLQYQHQNTKMVLNRTKTSLGRFLKVS